MDCPLAQLEQWLAEESSSGNIFPQGAVLCTVSTEGTPRSRVVSTMLDENKCPKFHTSPVSRKVNDIESNLKASLTYSFQGSLRSISLEGSLEALNENELDNDWSKLDYDFRKHYVVFGEISGAEIDGMDSLRKKRDEQLEGLDKIRPESFIGYKFSNIDRVTFYSVKEGDFADSALYEKMPESDEWRRKVVAP